MALSVCRTDSIDSYGGCLGGWWASAWPSGVSPTTASYTTTVSDTGTQQWYAFVCDAVYHCSPAWSGTFAVV